MTIQQDQQLVNNRNRIDAIDAGILTLLDERMKLAIQIVRIKKTIGKDIEDLSRETKLLEHLMTLNQVTCIEDEDIKIIYGKVLEVSKKIQEGEAS